MGGIAGQPRGARKSARLGMSGSRLGVRAAVPAAAVALLSTTLVGTPLTPSLVTWPANVLTVQPDLTSTTFPPSPQNFSTIQAAVDAAHPGDFILIAPGDYKTTTVDTPPAGAPAAGVVVTTPDIWLVGMDRNRTIVDGTQSGPPCSTTSGDQDFGPGGNGLNGIMVYKANGVWVENLTVCNFLAGAATTGATGNEIWWNGGANSGQVFGDGTSDGYWGSYLTATSTYFGGETTAAQYGIFSSNWNGGTWAHTYASNFNDAGYYIGACQQQCQQVVDDAHGEFSALGYSGSNAGGNLVIEHSEFDNNQDGFDTNSQNGDNPAPQDGACPNGGTSPITGTHSCWVFEDNYVHDNNNPNVPASGSAAAGPVGTGMSLSGGRNDTVSDNVFANNGAWGTILVPYPDSGEPCSGGTSLGASLGGPCLFDEYGDALLGNSYLNNGFFGNPTNGDIGAVNLEPNPTDCFAGNHQANGAPPRTSPPGLQLLYPVCTGQTVPPDLNALFTDEVACDSGSISLVGPVQGSTLCLPTAHYPRQSGVVMHALPGAGSLEDPGSSTLPTMTDPCADGVPANPWCPNG